MNEPMPAFVTLLTRLDTLLDRLEPLLPPPTVTPDWERYHAFRWRQQGHYGVLQAITHPHHIRLDDLQDVDFQKQCIDRNTRQFLQGKPANNVLLWGARGTGKSSLIKALLNEYGAQGLRLIEVDKHDLVALPDIVAQLDGRPERFIIFSDDLSFEQDDASYKALKSVLDGAISAPPDNVLLYATSNRRHLLPEYKKDNLDTRHVDGEIHHGEAVEEKISLSDRFGLWVAFYPFKQEEYLDIVHHWLRTLGVEVVDTPEIRAAALRWALARGSRSGRAAWQFAQDWVGQVSVEQD